MMRKTLFKWHSYSALIALVPILIISITGSVLVFKVELDSLFRPHQMVVQASTERKSLDKLMSVVQTTHPDYVLSGWELFGTHSVNQDLSSEVAKTLIEAEQRSDTAYAIKKNTDTWHKIYINQYSGELLSQPQTLEHYLTDWLLELHYAFLFQFSGTIIGAVFGLVLLFLAISGIVLYRKFWQRLFTMRWQSAKRILFSDAHKMIGIFTSPVLIIISFTGVYWNVSIILHEVLEHGFEEAHPPITTAYHSPTISFEALNKQASTEIDSFRATYLAIPNEPDMDITFFGEVDTVNPLLSQYGSMVTFDKNTGKLIAASDIRDASFLRKFDDSTRKLHFGYFAGIWSKVIWCIVGLAPVFLLITGVTMFWLRQRPKRANRLKRRTRAEKTLLGETQGQ